MAKVAKKQCKILEMYIRPGEREETGNMLPKFQD